MEVNKEIEEMLNALGDPTPTDVKVEDDDDEKDEETPEQKAEREAAEKVEADAEAERLAEEERRKNETDEEREAREAAEAAEAEAANKLKEKEALDKIESDRKAAKDAEAAAETAKAEAEERRKKAEEPLKLDEHDFLGDLDLDDLTRNKEAFNKLLNAVYAKGVNDSKKIATEGVLMTVPDIVKHNINLMTALTEAKDNFYKQNEDLVPFKAVVAAVFEEVAAKNADKKLSEIMDLVAPEVRTRLQLKREAVKKEEKKEEKNKDNPPRLHGTKGGGKRGDHREKPDTSGVAGEIAAMNRALGINN